MLGGPPYCPPYLHPSALAPPETFALDHNQVPWVAEGEVPPQGEGGRAAVARVALGALADGAVELPVREEGWLCNWLC